jgi:energy-coupling factor transporter ATP-binding protein EcfA2
MNLDNAAESFATLMPGLQAAGLNNPSEADTRAKLIDTLLIDVLGWDESNIKREHSTSSGFIDYLFGVGGRSVMVIEAKKAAIRLTSTKAQRRENYKLYGPALVGAIDGIHQAIGYCQAKSVAFAGLTTGLEWVAFLAVRTDGTEKATHKAIVFPSLDAIAEDFATFYDLFSKEGVLERLYLAHINEAEGIVVKKQESLREVIPTSQQRMLQRSDLASDLDRVFSQFFSAMSGDKDPELLEKCFVETAESRAADEALEKITARLTNEIQAVTPQSQNPLERSIRNAVETHEGEFVLLVGNKGAGKSTFTDRFFSSVLPPEIRRHCLLLRVDLRDSDGDLSTLQSWLTNALIKKAEGALFKDKTPDYDDLLGMFFVEYQRWAQGEYKHLYAQDKNAFKIKFGDFMADQSRNQPADYLKRLLHRAVASSKLMPCLVFDNTDHYTIPFQEAVFQYAQAIHRAVFSFVILPITDNTVWQLSKSGPFQSYFTKSFYLPVPSVKEILTKRIAFVKEKLASEERESGSYFLSKGIKLDIRDLHAFASGLEEIFIERDYTARTISWLANFDIRRCLQITSRLFTSPWILIDSLFKTYVIGKRLAVENRSLYKAIVLGNYNHFNQEKSEFILNLLSVHSDDLHSPLLRLSVIRFLVEKEAMAETTEEAYVEMHEVERYLEAMAVPPNLSRREVKQLIDRRLVEPYDPTDSAVEEGQRIRVSASGKLHSELAMTNETYVTEMALVTPMRHGPKFDKIQIMFSKGAPKLLRSDWENLIQLFTSYCVEQDRLFVVLPPTSSYDGQRQIRQEFQNRWTFVQDSSAS